MIDQTDAWLDEAKQGKISWEELAERILQLGQNEIPDSVAAAHSPDHDRKRRCGFGEVIFGQGKTTDSIIQIAKKLLATGDQEVLVTRISQEDALRVQSEFQAHDYEPLGRTLRISMQEQISTVRRLPCPSSFKSDLQQPNLEGSTTANPWLPAVVVVTAGSTDRPVAQEAQATLRWMGVDADLICDVGVAGPYRLLKHLPQLRQAAVVVVAAGMEGALASVVGGLVPCPIIAVPTSVGYGFNLEGITTLLSMMSSCAAGVTTVNIDAGFKGGYVAGLIAHRAAEHAIAAAAAGAAFIAQRPAAE